MSQHVARADREHEYTADDLDYFADELARISAVTHRKRLCGYPDLALEVACVMMQHRLQKMRQEVRRA